MQSTKVDIHEQSLYRNQQDDMDSSAASLPNATDRIGEDDDEQEYNVDEEEYEDDSSSIGPEEDAADEEEISSLVKESQMSLDELLAAYGVPTSDIGHSPSIVTTAGSAPSQSVRSRATRLANRNVASSAAAPSTCTTADTTNDLAGEEVTMTRVDAKAHNDPSEAVKKRTSDDDATVALSTPPNKRCRRGPSSPDSTGALSSVEPNFSKLPKPQSGGGGGEQVACDAPPACSISSGVQSTSAVSSSSACSNSDGSQKTVVEQDAHHHLQQQQHHHHHHQHQHRPRQLLSRSSHTSPTRQHHHRRLATIAVAAAPSVSGTSGVVAGAPPLPLQSRSAHSGFPPRAANWPLTSHPPLRSRTTSLSAAAEAATVPVEASVDNLGSEARRRVLPSVEQQQGLLLPSPVDDDSEEVGEGNVSATRVFCGDNEGPAYCNEAEEEEEEEVVDDEDEEDDQEEDEEDGEALSVKVAVGASGDSYPERFWKRAIVDDDSSHSYNSEEDEDYTPSSESGDDWRGEIRVGDEYQAQVPLSVSPNPAGVSNTVPEWDNNELETAKRLWLPGRLSELDVVQYERLSAGSGSYPLPAQRTVDDEETLYLLMLCDFNVEEALERIAYRTAPPLDIPGYLETWSEADALAFEKGFITYNKDFRQIRETRLRHKSIGELVQYYYLWKKTARYDEFARVYRRDKKRSHPSITDFMDCLAVEQEKIAEAYTAPNVALVDHPSAAATTTANLPSSAGCTANGQDNSATGNVLGSHWAPLPTTAAGHPGGRFGSSTDFRGS